MTTTTVQSREAQLHDWQAQGQTDPLPLVGLNLGFTQNGLQKLVPGADLGDASFKAGAASQAAALGDSSAAGTLTTCHPNHLAVRVPFR
jgi:hypothetical protein